jgi:DNA repair exonuclease SbcCD nuclease subunit
MSHFLVTGDWHIRASKPRYRMDKSYVDTEGRKLEWLFATAEKYNCSAILQPGDMFDSYDIPNYMKINLVNKFRAGLPVYSIYGQHDLKYRNHKDTVMSLFDTIGVVKVFDQPHPVEIDDCNIYGSGWDEPVPNIVNSNKVNILLTHEMIVGDGALWYGQEDYIEAKDALKKWDGFDLIVSGDNHQSFHYMNKKRMLLNCGSLMRTSISQVDHKPVVWIYDSVTKTAECLEIPIDPIEEIMDLDLADTIKLNNKKLDEYNEYLSSDYSVELDFEKTVFNSVKINKVKGRTQAVVKGIFKSYYDELGVG